MAEKGFMTEFDFKFFGHLKKKASLSDQKKANDREKLPCQ